MIRFLRAIDLMDYVGNQNQLSFCLMMEDTEKLRDLEILQGLTPSYTILYAYNKSQKTDKDMQILKNSYREELKGFTALIRLKGITDMSNAGMDFNIVCNTSPLCRMCVEELSNEFVKLTTNVEVLL